MLALYYLFQFTWGLLQNTIGFILFLLLPNKERFFYHGAIVSRWNHRSSMAMGIFIFYGHNTNKILSHEYGHTIQSIILGPFYLMAIGIPSLLWASVPYFHRLRKRKQISYFSLYCEKWASHLSEKFIHEEAAH